MKYLNLIAVVFFAAFAFSACQPSQRILEDSKQNEPAPAGERTPKNPTGDDYEDRLKSVQLMGFQFIYSFKKKDGSVFAGEDKRYLKENSPRDTNQWVLTTDEKAVIAGTNYVFTPENLDNLRKRFEVKEFSNPADNGNNNVNVNSNTNSNTNTANVK